MFLIWDYLFLIFIRGFTVTKMVINKRKIIFPFSLFLVIFLTGMIFLTSWLTKQRQEIRKKAASPSGIATVSFAPASGNFSVGQIFPVAVKINPNGVDISSVQISFNYDFAGQTPEIEIEDADLTKSGIQIPEGNLPLNYDLPNSNIALIDTQNKKVTVILAAYSLTGYTSSQEVTLTTINFRAVSPVNQKTISFDPTLSKITKLEDGQDILKTPTSTGTYTIGNLPTGTITPPITLTPTIPTPTITPGPTTSPPFPTLPPPTTTPILTVTSTITPRPTSSPPLPTPTPFVCPRGNRGNLDCSREGLIDSRDLELMIGSWTATSPAPLPPTGQWSADLNGDNMVNETDLSILLANWGYPPTLPTPTREPAPTPTTTELPTPTPTLPAPVINCPNSVPVVDTYIDAYFPDRRYDLFEWSNNQIFLEKGNVITAKRGLIKFDLSGTPTNSLINSASLRLYLIGWGDRGEKPGSIKAFRLKRPWVEEEATWNKASKNQNWEKAGADGQSDREQDILGENWVTDLGYFTIDITLAVKDWISHPETNFGLILTDGMPGIWDKSANTQFYLLSSEFAINNTGPCLIIN